MKLHRVLAGVMLLVACVLPDAIRAQAPKVTSPVQEFGHNFGDDYFLANYKQIEAYWRKLDRESDRMVVQSIGRTAEGREQLMAIVTSPENHKNLARYKEISKQLALAEGLTDAQARALAKEGKPIVWIDGGLHANETLGAQQLGEMVYRMVSATDDETMRVLRDVVILFVHANPDGNDLVADWYMRNADPAQRSLGNLPRLYQKYIGHDNNRDFFASTQPETENINRVLYREWYPQILYNHHQSGPQGTVLWSPPLRDPFNYNQDPLLVLGIQTIGIALHSRLAAENKPGATARSGGPYDGWWNGGIRNTAAFHNTIAILTEMIGTPTPMRVPLVMDRQVPNSDLTFPVPPQEWHFRKSIDYSVSCNLAILDMAAKMGENFLYNRYVMGRNSIDRGNTDTWTPAPHRYNRIVAEVRATPGPGGGGAGATTGVQGRAGGAAGGRGGGGGNETALWAALHRPEDRDPRAYILPSSQPDYATATRFINALLETGIRVHRATREFTAGGKTYPAGSYVVQTNQAFRPHVIDMFEPQDHPDNFAYQGAPPTRPYDNAGWTLAIQMGVAFDRHLEPVSGPFEVIPDWNLPMPPGRAPAASPFYALSPAQIDAFTAVNRLLAAGEEVYRAADGSFVVTGKASTLPVLRKLAGDRGVTAIAAATRPASARKLSAPRIGLWDAYGGSIDSGWARWILEQFEFPYARVFAPQLDAGNLNAKYDTLVFVDGAIPAAIPGGGRGGGAGGGGAGGGGGAAAPPAGIPEEYRAQMGSVSAERTIPQLKAFVEQGGTIVAIGGAATNLARHLGVPIENHLMENGQPLTQQKYYVPGSVLRARVDTTQPATAGLAAETNFFFDNSPVWKLGQGAQAAGVTPLAWFDTATPLASGWAWGQEYLRNGVIAVEARVGKGRLLLYGPEILQRAQPHPTFKLLFNGIY
ncbi:MAG TPA: M14 metallopeptidase family protein [Vicinamibacterales bacterium]|nr:M14 metallopeptidase family protein [Vicinamibacterales bacterium]